VKAEISSPTACDQPGVLEVSLLVTARARIGPRARQVGAAGDNAAMESFFSLLQNNVLKERRRDTREELRLARRDLDRADLPPATPPTTPRQTAPPSSSR
jgi:hypothetical protein